MAFNKAPTTIFPGYTSDGTNITIPIAALSGLTVAEAHTTTGDWRSILLSLCHTTYTYYYGLATADRPTAFVTRPPVQIPISSGTFEGDIKITYSFDFYSTLCPPDVVNEPV